MGIVEAITAIAVGASMAGQKKPKIPKPPEEAKPSDIETPEEQAEAEKAAGLTPRGGYGSAISPYMESIYGKQEEQT